MTFDRLGRWRLPAIAGLSLLIALTVVIAILLLGRAPTVIDGPPSPSATQPTDASPPPDDTPEAAVRAFFEAFAEARETDDPALIEPFVNGTDSSAYQTAAGFLLGQQEVGKASVTTVQKLSDFDVEVDGMRAIAEFTYVAGGYDIDLESREPLESPSILEPSRVRAELARVNETWLLDGYEEVTE
ncbi:MAG: hypothetical protein ABJC24_00245 [Chloroflexota bacterium]